VFGRVTRIVAFGAFVDLGGVSGLVHISELSDQRVKHVDSVVSEGDEILVKIIGIDPEKKHISLSIKQAAIEEEDDDELRYEDDDEFDDDDE